MSIYWLSFTLDSRSISGRSYDERYQALYDAIGDLSTRRWVETTAFIVFESSHSLAQVAAKAKVAVSKTYDTVLVRYMDKQDAVIIGKVEDETIFDLMPYLAKG